MCRVQLIIFLFLSLLIVPSCDFNRQSKEEPIAEIDHIYEYDICVDSLDITKCQINKGENPSTIFSRLGFSLAKADSICKVTSKVLDPTKLRAGMHYDVFTTRDSLSAIKYIVFAKSKTCYAVIDLSGDTIAAYDFNKDIIIKRRYSEGVVTSSLWNAIKEQGDNPLLAIELSDIYAWQIDFFDIKKGDSYMILYDVAYIDDSVALDIVSIEGAMFNHRKKIYHAIPFAQDSISEYFDEDGNSLRRAFLKAPLDFFRITSKFTNSRFHPVLKRYRAHHGVDYAAPVGTPVKTIGDGVVIAKGYQSGGGGNFLKIKHNTAYTTTYMHLNGFAKGLQQGSRVTQGQVIAYVGSTGLSTGPHLDFRVHRNGVAIDPLKMESPPSLPIRPELRDSFSVVKRKVLSELNDLRHTRKKSKSPKSKKT